MQVALKIVYVVFSPLLAIQYWRNSMRTVENLHALEWHE